MATAFTATHINMRLFIYPYPSLEYARTATIYRVSQKGSLFIVTVTLSTATGLFGLPLLRASAKKIYFWRIGFILSARAYANELAFLSEFF